MRKAFLSLLKLINLLKGLKKKTLQISCAYECSSYIIPRNKAFYLSHGQKFNSTCENFFQIRY